MSFAVEFFAVKKDALKALSAAQESPLHLPEPVRAFLWAAVSGIKGDSMMIAVKAHGHLTTGSDYEFSNATIEVKPIHLWKPS